MRVWSFFVFLLAAGGSVAVAQFGVQKIEVATEKAVRAEITTQPDLGWVSLDTDGLLVFLAGTAPDEATRARAISAAGRVVDTARLINQMEVAETEGLAAPRFSLEILRNGSGLSVFGLVPADAGVEILRQRLKDAAGDAPLSDFIETAKFAQPATWDAATRYAIEILSEFPRAKVSVTSDYVSLTAMAATPEASAKLERELKARAPRGVTLGLSLSVPRPVVSPYTLRFVRNGTGTRFDSCHAPEQTQVAQIINAAAEAGLSEGANCRVALGTPGPRWTQAATLGLRAIAAFGGGALTMTDSDIALIAPAQTAQADFDAIAGELDTALPPGFVLTAVLPGAVEEEGGGPAQFTATLSPEGLVQLRGQINSKIARDGAESFAKAIFGSDTVHMAARIDSALPTSWPLRVLAALAAMGELSNGIVTVSPAHLEVRGTSSNPEAAAAISGILTGRLGDGALFDIGVTYQEPAELSAEAAAPTPKDCVLKISDIIGERKITFEPGSAKLDGTTGPLMDEIAELLKLCGEFPLEIQGHTDSQGREIMNQELSQKRAQAVIDALFQRRVLTGSYTARGYGETQPIADNGSEEGREANRRIEFVLIQSDDSEASTLTTLEQAEQTSGDSQ